MANPMIENLKNIRDTVTNKSVAVTSKSLKLPFDWRTAINDAIGVDGGIDSHAGQRDTLKPRTIDAMIVRKYGVGESFATVTHDLEVVIGRGNPLELTFAEDTGVIWYWSVRLSRFDKTHAIDFVSSAEFSLQFIAADPRQRAAVKPNAFLLDNGLLLDNGVYFDDDADNVPLTGLATSHAINNTIGSASDEAPSLDLFGPMVGPIVVTYADDAGNTLSVQYASNIAAGEHVRIDGAQLEVTSSTGANAYAAFSLPANQESWGRIAPGQNTVLLTCSSYGANAAFTTSWFPRK